MRTILSQNQKPLIWLGLIGFVLVIAASATGFWGHIISWIYGQQQALHQELIAALRTLRGTEGWLAAGPLIAISFFYGLFHAAGPGHGKVIISTYLLANRDDVPRGLILAALAALMQGIVAVSLIYGLVYVAGLVPRDTKSAVDWSERLGFGLVILLGIMLVLRAIRTLKTQAQTPKTHHHDHSHDHHHHTHDDNCGCGHAHAPALDEIRAARDWKASLAIILSIGLRPCTGAILVLVFAIVTKQFWAGIASVFAMSAGTAIAISLLAVLTIAMRDTASRMADIEGNNRFARLTPLITLAGGAALILIGGSLFQASFQMRGGFGL